MEDKVALLGKDLEDISKTNKEILEKLDILERRRNEGKKKKQSNGEEQTENEGKVPKDDMKGHLDENGGQIPGQRSSDVSSTDDRSFMTTPGFMETLTLQMEHVLYGSCLRRKRCNMNQDNRICLNFDLTPNQGCVYAARIQPVKEVCRPKLVAKRLESSEKKRGESEKKQNALKDSKKVDKPNKEIGMRKMHLNRIEQSSSKFGDTGSAKMEEKTNSSKGLHKQSTGLQSKGDDKSLESSKNQYDKTNHTFVSEPQFSAEEEKPIIIDPNQWVQEANKEIDIGRERFIEIKETGLDTVICLDCSASMRGVAWEDAMKFVNGFLDWLLANTSLRDDTFDNVALVTFGSVTGVQQHLTCDLMSIKEKVGKLKPGGTSPLNAGLLFTRAVMIGAGSVLSCNGYSIKPRILLITDGKFTPCNVIGGPDRADDLLSKMEEHMHIVETAGCLGDKENSEIYPVPVGECNVDILELLAEKTGGRIVDHRDWVTQAATYRNYRTATQIGISQKQLHVHMPFVDIDSIVAAIMPGATESDLLQIKEFLATHKPDSDSDECEEDGSLPLGTRVKRVEALAGPEYRNTVGTVTAHFKKGRIVVTWDRTPHGRDQYRENVAYGPEFKEVEVVDSPRVLTDELIAVGCRVRRGPDWRYPDQDGGEGGLGTVLNINNNGIVNVRWDIGTKNSYRFGADAFDLEVVNPQETGRRDMQPESEIKQSQNKNEVGGSRPITSSRDFTLIEEYMNLKNAEESKKAAAEANVPDESVKDFKTLDQSEKKGPRNVDQTEGASQEERDTNKNELDVMAMNQRNARNEDQAALSLPGPKDSPCISAEGLHTEMTYNWQWLNEGEWQSYPKDIALKIEKSFQRNPSGTTVIYHEGQQFRLIFSKMEKTNTTTKQKTKIKRN